LIAKKAVNAPKEIKDLAQQRIQAKADKNYSLADSLRDQISDAGWIIKDVTDGFELEQL
jgi:cysteinyl-tRNA synthetase